MNNLLAFFSPRMLMLTLFLLMGGCTGRPEINCDGGNINKLLEEGRKFVLGQIKLDKKTNHMEFDHFKIDPSSCRAPKDAKYVSFELEAKHIDGSQGKNVSFDCRFGNIRNNKNLDALCQMK